MFSKVSKSSISPEQLIRAFLRLSFTKEENTKTKTYIDLNNSKTIFQVTMV